VGVSLSARQVVSSCDLSPGAYVHVPFCASICPFCPYNKVVARDDLARRYFASLAREIAWYVDALTSVGRGPFTSLYIGGGTPTLYPEQVARIIASIPTSGERAIEVLPLHGTPERLDVLAEAGITAVSIGAQSFHDPVLRRLRRPHTAAHSLAAVENALPRFDCVDVDLIVDVSWDDDPRTAGAFLTDLEHCVSRGVDQVSTYPLMRFGYTPFGMARHDRHREHEVLREAEAVAQAYGYRRTSVWTFGRPASTPYTSITRRRFIGMGAGSASFTGADFYVNHFGLDQYSDDVEADRLPVARWLHLGRAAGRAYDLFWQAYSGSVGGYRLGPWGFDRYHDLERWVTYHLIEPLWAQMLTEHADPGWAVPRLGRRSRVWDAASALFERQPAA
jgi:oxygen-independent coproporphyrinogen-3 oxidase